MKRKLVRIVIAALLSLLPFAIAYYATGNAKNGLAMAFPSILMALGIIFPRPLASISIAIYPSFFRGWEREEVEQLLLGILLAGIPIIILVTILTTTGLSSS